MMSLTEVQQHMATLTGWSLETTSISKNFQFTNFKESLDFVNKVGEIAESHNHHPDILINYDQVHLSLSTHSEHGLTSLDFKVAKEIDMI